MLLAICRIVLLMLSGILLEDKQNFRFNPSNSFVPGGSLLCLHRLWKARFTGCGQGFGSGFRMAMLKFCCRVKFGLAENP